MERSNWSSRFGFILAAAGSAVGLGAIWKFPYVAAKGGGGAFVIIYLLFVFTIGLSMLASELMIGRNMQSTAVPSYRRLGGFFWEKFGYLSLISLFIIYGFYSIVGGWVIYYLFNSLSTEFYTSDPAKLGILFYGLVNKLNSSLFYCITFMFITVFFVIRGINQGIEKLCKFAMPVLFFIMIFFIIKSLSLPGAIEGLSAFLVPNWSNVSLSVIIEACGMAVFSLSIGAGLMIAYGSYLKPEAKVFKSSFYISVIACLSSILAGLMILPTVFSFGVELSAGPGLTFITLPGLISQMDNPTLWFTLFMSLLFVAALTSSISIVEPIVSYLVDEKGIRRSVSALLVSSMSFLLISVPSILSMMDSAEYFVFFGKSVFDIFDYTASNILLPIGGIVATSMVGFVAWEKFRPGVESELQPKVVGTYRFMVVFICPLAFLTVLFANLYMGYLS